MRGGGGSVVVVITLVVGGGRVELSVEFTGGGSTQHLIEGDGQATSSSTS